MAVAVELKALPPEEAIAFFRQKGYRPTFSYLDMMHQAHADAFTVAGVTRLDVLQDLRSAVDDALAKGTTFAEFKKTAKEKLQAKGWWGPVEVTDEDTGDGKVVNLSRSRRLRTIFNTNLRTSRAAGQWTRIQRTKKALPYLKYSAVMDNRTRPLHRQWHGTVLAVDDPWWDEHFPPNDWECRCDVLQMTAGMVKRAGLTVAEAAPVDGPDVPFTNKRTGEVFKVPPGIAPSFAYNVGKTASFPDPARYTGEAFGREASLLSVASRGFERLIARQVQGAAPVGWVDDTIAAALDVVVRRVDLSADTVEKQATNHRDLTLGEYRQLPGLVAEGLVVDDGSKSGLQIFGLARDQDGTLRLYRAAVKRTGTGEALFLTTFHKARWRQLLAILERQPIRDQATLRSLKFSPEGVVE